MKKEFIQRIRQSIADEGFFCVQRVLSEDDFDHICRRLGGILSTEEVRIKPTPFSVHGSKGLPLHTDDHSAHYISWQCLAQDNAQGASLFLDTKTFEAGLTTSEKSALGRVYADIPKGGSVPFRQFLYQGEAGFFYNPWIESFAPDEEATAVFDKFKEYIATTEPTAIRLDPGQCLFLNNRRMLHGRTDIPEGSKRFLRRNLIVKDAVAIPRVLVGRDSAQRIYDLMDEKKFSHPGEVVAFLAEQALQGDSSQLN